MYMDTKTLAVCKIDKQRDFATSPPTWADVKQASEVWSVEALDKEFGGLCKPCIVGTMRPGDAWQKAFVYCPTPDKPGHEKGGAAHMVEAARAKWFGMSKQERAAFAKAM